MSRIHSLIPFGFSFRFKNHNNLNSKESINFVDNIIYYCKLFKISDIISTNIFIGVLLVVIYVTIFVPRHQI